MLSKLLTLVFFMTVFGCENKKFEKSDNSNIQTVNNLNHGHHQSVISSLANKSNLTDRERYYLASAYSMAGSVDVFSLYPVLEIQLFHKNALEWTDLSANKNPYLRFFQPQGTNIDKEKRNAARLRNWNKLEKKIKKKYPDLVKPTLTKLNERNGQRGTVLYSQSDYDLVDQDLMEAKTKLIEANSESRKGHQKSWEKKLKEMIESRKYNVSIFNDLSLHYTDVGEFEYRKRIRTNPEFYDGSTFDGMSWDFMAMTLLWNTYEAIPVVQKLPSLSEENQHTLTLAIAEYTELLNSDEFAEAALKNIGIVTSVSVLNYYKQSLELDNINSLEDLFCNFEPKKLVENYEMIRLRLVALAKAYQKVKHKIKVSAQLEDAANTIEEKLPERLSLRSIRRYVNEAEDWKVERCFND